MTRLLIPVSLNTWHRVNGHILARREEAKSRDIDWFTLRFALGELLYYRREVLSLHEQSMSLTWHFEVYLSSLDTL